MTRTTKITTKISTPITTTIIRITTIIITDRKSTRLNSSHGYISYAVFCLKKKKKKEKEKEKEKRERERDEKHLT